MNILWLLAVIGTVMFLIDPLRRFLSWARGKRISELDESLNCENEGMAEGCGFQIFLFSAAVYAFILEPATVLVAIFNGLGNQHVGYAMFIVILVEWVFLFCEWKSRMRGSTETDESKVEADEIVDIGNPIWLFIGWVCFYLPIAYMWYLILVVKYG